MFCLSYSKTSIFLTESTREMEKEKEKIKDEEEGRDEG